MSERDISDAVMLGLWRKGCDTLTIAHSMRLTEAVVYALLWRVRQDQNIEKLAQAGP